MSPYALSDIKDAAQEALGARVDLDDTDLTLWVAVESKEE